MSTTTRILTEAGSLRTALSELATWADELRFAFAWIQSANGAAEHWKLLPLDKVRRAVVGIAFAQTEPAALRQLAALSGVLKVVPDTEGVFHPKVLLALKGDQIRALIGSSNLTTGGYKRNIEANVLLDGKRDAPELHALTDWLDEQWEHPRTFVPDEAWLVEYEETYANRPRPPSPPKTKAAIRKPPASRDDLDVPWATYYGFIRDQEQRVLTNGVPVHVFENPEGSWLREIEMAQEAFAREPRFAKLPVEERKQIAGWGDRTSGYLGRMDGAGYFKQLSVDSAPSLGKFLDAIPLTGLVSRDVIATTLAGMLQIEGVGIASASRLLSVKRPDLFVPWNQANAKLLKRIFGIRVHDTKTYTQLHEAIWQLQWFDSAEPGAGLERQTWKARVALLDALAYDIPEYVRSVSGPGQKGSEESSDRHFLVYWRPETVADRPDTGDVVAWSASNQYDRLRPGDVTWVVSADTDGRIGLVGRMAVAEVLTLAMLKKRYPSNWREHWEVWRADYYAFAPRDGAEAMRRVRIDDLALDLRFVGTKDRLPRDYSPQNLQTMRLLTTASAAKMEARWRRADA